MRTGLPTRRTAAASFHRAGAATLGPDHGRRRYALTVGHGLLAAANVAVLVVLVLLLRG